MASLSIGTTDFSSSLISADELEINGEKIIQLWQLLTSKSQLVSSHSLLRLVLH